MAILGITNRTENWRTAEHFVPLSGDARVRLVDRLLREPTTLDAGEIHAELFWRGMRDHFHGARKGLDGQSEILSDHYVDSFPNLRGSVEDFAVPGGFRKLKECNYDVSTESRKSKLASNLFNTEIDIVLESPGHLFIGEAKHEMSFHAHSALILTHQLIRQYVMACILLELREQKKEVVPFVVGDSAAAMKKTAQVRFMIKRGYMSGENVLEWGEIEALW